MALLSLFGVLVLSGQTQAHEGSLRPGRKLFHWSTEKRMIWGHCDHLDREIMGCSVQGKCSDYASPGPEDADIEVTLGGLPASAPGNSVHLHWWAARRSPTQYNPLESPKYVTVYKNMCDAYPKFFEPAFNGGNVRVNESGQATIRVRAPATYLVWPHLAIPNIKLRLCQKETFMQNVADRVIFGIGEQWLVTGPETAGMQILHARQYTPPPGTPQPNASVPVQAVNWQALEPRPFGYVCKVSKRSPGTTTLAATITQTTTSTVTTTTAVAVPSTVQGMDLEAARDALDLDALEFSPVYICLLRGQAFDHFTNDCASSCPDDTVQKHGQCVRPLTNEGIETFTADWQLEVLCSPTCALDRTNMTLHGLRLSVAGHLQVPFQEVENVAFGYDQAVARRLAGETSKVLHLHVTVHTGRLMNTDGTVLLTTWLSGADQASQLLGLHVQEIRNARPENDPFTEDGNLGSGNDPYNSAYDSIEASLNEPAHGSSLTAGGKEAGIFTAEVIAGIVGGIFFIGMSMLVGVGLYLYRRIRRRNAARDFENSKLGNVVQGTTASKLPKEAVAGNEQEEDNDAPQTMEI